MDNMIIFMLGFLALVSGMGVATLCYQLVMWILNRRKRFFNYKL